MLLRSVHFFSLCLVLISCARENSPNTMNLEQSYDNRGCYRKNPDFSRLEMKTPREYKGVSLFQPMYAIKNGDTTNISELICLDSILFTQAFSEIKVGKMCNEFGIQGNTYYSTYTNKYGGFEDVKVVRSLDNCFKDTEKQILLKASEIRILQEVYFDSEIVFYHNFRLK